MFEFLFFAISAFSGVVFSLIFCFLIKSTKINPVYIVFALPVLCIVILSVFNIKLGLFLLSAYLFSLPVSYFIIPENMRNKIEKMKIF